MGQLSGVREFWSYYPESLHGYQILKLHGIWQGTQLEALRMINFLKAVLPVEYKIKSSMVKQAVANREGWVNYLTFSQMMNVVLGCIIPRRNCLWLCL